MTQPDRPTLATVRSEPSVAPAREQRCRGWCARQGRGDCGREGCNTVAQSQSVALYVRAVAHQQHKRVEPYAIGAALALLTILGAAATGLVAWLVRLAS